MPCGVGVDSSGIASAPMPDTPKMMAREISLLNRVIPEPSPYFRSATGVGLGTLAASGVLDGEWKATSKMNAPARQ
jgi:hypothetical protein